MKKTLTTLVSVLSVLVGCAGEETTDPPASCTTSAGGHDAGPLTVVTMDVAVVTDSGTGGEGGASACETIPPEQACAGKCSAFAPIGCGLTIPCDPHCGDTSGTMTCGSDGDCQCAHASTRPGYDLARAACNPDGGNAHQPFYCGSVTDDAPPNCHDVGVFIAPASAALWCCDF